MDVAAETLSRAEVYKLMAGSIVPRPVAWITTRSVAGVVNAAPFSAFTLLSQDPPILLFQADRHLREKDTSRNIRETGQFAVHIANESLLEKMHLCSTPLPPETSETDAFGIELVPGTAIDTPRIAAAPVCFECRLHSHFDIGNEPHTVFIGQVVHFHVDDDILVDGKIDQHRLKPVARIGGPWYAKLGEHVYMPVATGLRSDW